MISIVVAMYNEEAVLPAFLNTFFEHIDLKEPYELLLVNDGSTDASVSIAKTFQKKHRQIRIVSYHPNRGLGHALQMGIAKARGRVIVTMDADLAHHPKYVSTLVDISDQGHDLVIGSRYAKGGGIDEGPFVRWVLSQATNLITRLAILTGVKDLTTGFRAYKAGKIKSIKSNAKGFDVEVDILVTYLRKRWSIREVPVRAPVDRAAGQSKFNLLQDSVDYTRGLFRAIVLRWF